MNKKLAFALTAGTLLVSYHLVNSVEYELTKKHLLSIELSKGLYAAHSVASFIIQQKSSGLEKIVFYGSYCAANQYLEQTKSALPY